MLRPRAAVSLRPLSRASVARILSAHACALPEFFARAARGAYHARPRTRRPAMRHAALVTAALVLFAAAPRARAADAEPAAGTAIVHPFDGAVMVYVPAGEFIMGSDRAEATRVAQLLGVKYEMLAAEE